MRTDPRKACKNEDEKLFWALVHDGLAHPLMAVTIFSSWAVAFHDWTSKRAWPRPKTVGCGGPLLVTLNKETAFAQSDTYRRAGVAHVTTSRPIGGGVFAYEVEAL